MSSGARGLHVCPDPGIVVDTAARGLSPGEQAERPGGPGRPVVAGNGLRRIGHHDHRHPPSGQCSRTAATFAVVAGRESAGRPTNR